MTEAAVVYTALPASDQAGLALGTQIIQAMGEEPPDALIVFASPKYDYTAFLPTLKSTCHPKLMIGCSSAGEFISYTQGEGAACAIAIRSSEMHFAAGIGRGLSTRCPHAAQELVSSFRGLSTHDYIYRSALVLSDALAGHADQLVEHLTLLTAGTYQLFGGGAGDDAHFHQTQVFFDTEVAHDAVVALEILSNKPLGVGISHGWQPASAAMRVTEAEGMRLISVNAAPAVEIFEEHAQATGQRFERTDPVPFFLHNVIGIDTGQGYKLRVPLSVNPDGSIACAADVPVGATIRLMTTQGTSAAEAAARAIQSARRQLNNHPPKVALFFDCVATRLRMGREFGFELQTLQQALGPAHYAGFNTYGQIARAEGQFSGFHNCTAVVCLIPE